MMYQKSKERGWVMRILDRVYPDGLDKDIIKKQLIDLRFTSSDIDIRGILFYLEDKGLIQVKKVGNKELERTVVILTSKGKDLIDNVIEPIVGVDL